MRPARPGEAVSCRHPGQYRRWSAVADCSMASTRAAAGLLLTTLQARQLQVRQWLQAADNHVSQAAPRLLQIFLTLAALVLLLTTLQKICCVLDTGSRQSADRARVTEPGSSRCCASCCCQACERESRLCTPCLQMRLSSDHGTSHFKKW